MAGFDVNSAKRIARATRWVEDRYRNAVGRAESPFGSTYNKLGITTSAITARSGKTPGAGSVQPYNFDGTSLVVVDDAAETVFNWTGSSIAANIWVEYRIVDGYLFLVGQDCSGVAP